MDSEMRKNLMSSLLSAMGGLFTQPDSEFEAFGPLSPEDKAEFDSMIQAQAILNNKKKALDAEDDVLKSRRKMFWVNIETKLGIYDKNMRISDSGVLLIEKDEKDKPEKEDPLDFLNHPDL